MPVTEGPHINMGQEGEVFPIYTLSSAEDIGSFADAVVINLNISQGLPNFAPEVFREGIGTFLEIVYSSPHANSIAMSRRIMPVKEANIDIDVLWSSLSEEDHTREIEALFRGHSDFWATVRPNVDSFFHILSPARHPSIDLFKANMENRPDKTLLAIAEFKRKSLV